MDGTSLKQIVKDTLNELTYPFKKDIVKKMIELKNSIKFMSDSFEELKKAYMRMQ